MIESEIEISEDLIRDLLWEQHPDLAELPIREVEGGWGNQMWRLGDELAVRMQRMEKLPDSQLKERRWLPVLAPRLPLPIPTPVRSGAPSERFPKVWTVMTWVEGTPLDHGSITRGDHAADTLAAFLKALHAEAPADAPDSSAFGAHPRKCTDGFESFLQAVDLGGFAEDDIRAVWDDAVSEERIAARLRSARGAVGAFTVELASDGTALGRVTLDKDHRAADRTEVSYEFLMRYQGMGYATEAVAEVVRWAVASAPYGQQVAAVTQAGNLRSRRLLERIGMVLAGEFKEFGAEQVLYTTRRRDHVRRAVP